MRKKSHISLARDIVRNSEDEGLRKHKWAFYLGSILPDIKPSFLYKKHEIDGTFEQVKKEIRELSDSHGKYREHATKYYRDLGQITHYIADYFTFPHNRTYPGNLKDHCSYEEVLKLRLREYLKTVKKTDGLLYSAVLAVQKRCVTFIKLRHEEYLRQKIDVEEDIRHIVSLNYQVVEGIRQLAEQGKLHQYLLKKRAA